MKFYISNINDKIGFENFLNKFVIEFPKEWKNTIEKSKLTKFAIKFNPMLKNLFESIICNWSLINEIYILTVILGIEKLPNVVKTMQQEIPEKIKNKFPEVKIEIEK
jgi:hypothetical protein